MSNNAKSKRSRISAGLLMFRRRKNKLEVLLAHPGGPFHVHKDDGAWTIPKGEAAPGEDLLTRAKIEFEEEVGFRPESSLPESFECRSNLFEMEWPPRSGKYQKFPEVDQACFFSEEVGRRKLKQAQVPLLDRLHAAIKG